MSPTGLNMRFGRAAERTALEELQRRASLVWEDYRADLLAHPEAIELPVAQLEERRVRVAEKNGEPVGFSVVLPEAAGISELDGLFVEPPHWHTGIGSRLISDAVDLARIQGARAIEVTANPRAQGFYAKCGFVFLGSVQTQFGPAMRMRLSL